jgi:hypothetical protein
MTPFAPCFIPEKELTRYGLPTPQDVPEVMSLVQFASSIIDEHCGRVDGDGNGSLVFTTYTQRILLQTRNRNLMQLPIKPIVAVDAATVTDLQNAASGNYNYTYTGVTPNTILDRSGQLSGLVAASGRYGYTRQDMAIAYPDLFAMINPLNLVTMFGGPAPWIPMDISNTDYDARTGEIWIPAGLQLQRYSEVLISYNSGYHPLAMPPAIKHACAALVKNALAKGAGTTALVSLQMGRSGANASFVQNLLDPTLLQLLTPYCNVRSY